MEYYVKSVISIIESNYHKLTSAEKTVADFFIHNNQNTDFSSSHIAELLYTSKATLSRFAKKIGYRGYQEFIYQYENTFEEKEEKITGNTKIVLNAYQEVLNKTYNLVDEAQIGRIVGYLNKADRVLVCGCGSSGLSAKEMEIRFMRIGIDVDSMTDSDMIKMALYMLSELEDNDIGFTMCNGDIVSEEKYIGWINQILGTNYSFRKRFNLWENVVWYIENEKCEEMHISMKELFELIPKNLRYAAGGTELADLLWIINGTSSLLPKNVESNSYAYDIWLCQRAIQEIFIKDLEDEEEKILSLLQMPRNRRRSITDPVMKKLAKFTLFLPARIILFLYTEFTGDNFWEIWSAIKSGAYHDEKMKKYASKELELYRKIFIEGPIAPVTTSDFLSQDEYFTFWKTPPELGGEENYYISDWDRLYWWGKIEDVEITEEIDIWLNMLVKEYEMILNGKEQETENAFVDHIFNTMEYLNSFYGRIYLFKEFYNELLNNSHEVRYQAILDLLDKFGEKNKEIGRVYQKYGNKEWCMLSKNLKCNRGRMEIKRIISVMANKELRKKYFGF